MLRRPRSKAEFRKFFTECFGPILAEKEPELDGLIERLFRMGPGVDGAAARARNFQRARAVDARSSLRKLTDESVNFDQRFRDLPATAIQALLSVGVDKEKLRRMPVEMRRELIDRAITALPRSAKGVPAQSLPGDDPRGRKKNGGRKVKTVPRAFALVMIDGHWRITGEHASLPGNSKGLNAATKAVFDFFGIEGSSRSAIQSALKSRKNWPG